MRILAIEREQPTAFQSVQADLLRAEAEAVRALLKQDIIRDIWFAPDRRAVIMLECPTMTEARQYLASLPLVRCGRVDFTLLELHAYDGFERLIATASPALPPKHEEPPEY